MNVIHSAVWLKIVATIPFAIFGWVLLARTPKSKRQWFWAVVMGVYIAVYYLIFIR